MVISPHSYSTEAEEVLCVIRQQTPFPLKWLNTGEWSKSPTSKNANEIKKTTSMSLLKRTSLSIQRYLCKEKNVHLQWPPRKRTANCLICKGEPLVLWILFLDAWRMIAYTSVSCMWSLHVGKCILYPEVWSFLGIPLGKYLTKVNKKVKPDLKGKQHSFEILDHYFR